MPITTSGYAQAEVPSVRQENLGEMLDDSLKALTVLNARISGLKADLEARLVGEPAHADENKDAASMRLVSAAPRVTLPSSAALRATLTAMSRSCSASVKRRPIAMGWDFGLNPSVVIAQRMVNGQLRVIDEVIGEGTGVPRFYFREDAVRGPWPRGFRACPGCARLLRVDVLRLFLGIGDASCRCGRPLLEARPCDARHRPWGVARWRWERLLTPARGRRTTTLDRAVLAVVLTLLALGAWLPGAG